MTSTFSTLNSVAIEKDYKKMTYKFSNIALPFSFSAMEPYIDSKTMELHHNGHLGNYISSLNNLLAPYPEFQNLTLVEMLTNLNIFPLDMRRKVANFAGGVFNHFFYFEQMTVEKVSPSADLVSAFSKYFGSVQEFEQQFKQAALSVFGSGYAWLVINTAGNLEIMSTANQDNPLSDRVYPLLNIDVWEHAYYLKHFFHRDAYVDDWFNTLNYNIIDQRILQIKS